jgi:hypothetical protein
MTQGPETGAITLKGKGWSSVLPGSIGAGDKGQYVFASVILFAMEEAMLHVSRSASVIGMPLVLAALLACITPAGAGIQLNGVSMNGVSMNGVSMNGVALNGSALGALNGVAVEAVIIPDAATR